MYAFDTPHAQCNSSQSLSRVQRLPTKKSWEVFSDVGFYKTVQVSHCHHFFHIDHQHLACSCTALHCVTHLLLTFTMHSSKQELAPCVYLCSALHSGALASRCYHNIKNKQNLCFGITIYFPSTKVLC